MKKWEEGSIFFSRTVYLRIFQCIKNIIKATNTWYHRNASYCSNGTHFQEL